MSTPLSPHARWALALLCVALYAGLCLAIAWRERHRAQRARDEAARLARLREPVKPGEVVPEIRLDNGDTVHDAIVVALQPTSVSFKIGARLYNIPTEELPTELRDRVRRMFPAPAAEEVAPVAQP